MPSTTAEPEPDGGPVRPGPKRAEGTPAGPGEVREAVLEAAATLFAESGVAHVSLRDIARTADVQLSLIRRYVGNRDALIDEVFRRVNADLSEFVVDHPLEILPFGRNSAMGRWIVMLTYYAEVDVDPPRDGPNPFRALAGILEEQFGIDEPTSRLRAAQIAAVTLGWRRFEGYLTSAAQLDCLERDELRSDVNTIQRMIGSTPWPTPSVD